MSSSELQYIIEMSGQRLLPVSNTDNDIPVSERLQLLRDKAHAWFKVDIHSSKAVLMKRTLRYWVAGGHVCSWYPLEDTARIFPILPEPSQRSFQRNWPPGTLCSVPHSENLDIIMDLAQNLIAVAYIVDNDNERVYINLGTLDGDEVHPQAAGERLFLSDDMRNPFHETTSVVLKSFGRHIALSHNVPLYDNENPFGGKWQLQVWDWKHSTTSSSILNGAMNYRSDITVAFFFLGNDRLLVTTDNLYLYSIEDMSQPPELLAWFLMPVSLTLWGLLPMDDIEHPQTRMLAQPTMYTSDPAHRLICLNVPCRLKVDSYTQFFIISTRIFFDLDGTGVATPIPWEHWGPSNARIFQHPYHGRVHISGNRVLQALPVGDSEYIFHLMDFSPLAATNSRGLGHLVKEPSTIEISTCRPGRSLTTSMPYVHVMFSDRKFVSIESALENIWIDKDRIYMLIADLDFSTVDGELISVKRPIGRLDVIDT
ncbi:hypothetical protein CY34DRAFT_16904 [Suillus luteus UH-Slu-Lm8-n1]|uniref:Unplaced genomic scaffold CY34scaffold_473, whole genome shotgun sequence n=1 Tax=Suillus luteus UH-Slu-Lm8-n1 TaxID=930992 RepID=A0A0C9ZDP5_9AGAM|nr:hypothetical protein CY34DRAFT_16904 [Suillus luteus UH-Slu-Lm8-n1]